MPHNNDNDKISNKKTPTGNAYPAIKINQGEHKELSDPIPVIMHSGFFWKMLGVLLIPTIGALSAAFSMYWKAENHIQRTDIHPDISILETKKDAQTARKQLIEEIKDKVELEIGKVQLQQKKQMDRFSDEMKIEQRASMNKILQEVQITRRAVNNAANNH